MNIANKELNIIIQLGLVGPSDRQYDIVVNPSKYMFGKQEIKFSEYLNLSRRGENKSFIS